MRTTVIIAIVLVALYVGFICVLLLLGRRSSARAVAGFVPDCVVLFRRLLADKDLPASKRWLLGAAIAYLALPFDLVPDFIPVAGQLDDAILVALVLRSVLKSGGTDTIRKQWPGPESSLRIVLRLAGTR